MSLSIPVRSNRPHLLFPVTRVSVLVVFLVPRNGFQVDSHSFYRTYIISRLQVPPPWFSASFCRIGEVLPPLVKLNPCRNSLPMP